MRSSSCRPAARPGAKHPALVFMHGGSRRQMLLGWHYMDYYNNAYAMNQYLASQGYVVLSINYRSGIGYGLNFREAINYGASGASEFNDVEGAGLYLRTRADVDPARIGLWGGSYGGYLTALGLARASDLFAAGVDFHGVHDWSARLPATAAAVSAGGAREDAARTAFESSPMASVRTWRSPVLLIHGDDDRNVNFSETIATGERAAPAGRVLRAADTAGRDPRRSCGTPRGCAAITRRSISFTGNCRVARGMGGGRRMRPRRGTRGTAAGCRGRLSCHARAAADGRAQALGAFGSSGAMASWTERYIAP